MIANVLTNTQHTTTVISVTSTNGYREYRIEKILAPFKAFAITQGATILNEQFIKDQINTVL